jgi:hypothetical protein
MNDADNQDEKAILDAERLLKTEEPVKKEEVPVKTEEEIAAETAAQEAEAAKAAEAAAAKPEEETEEDALIPHGEKSRLGRKVKRLEDTLGEIKGSLDFLKERSQVAAPEVEEELALPENPTAEEIRDFVKQDRARLLKDIEKQGAAKSKQEQESNQKYGMEYAKMVEDMLDPEEDAEVYKLMTDTKDLTYNQVYKRDAKEDFLINYRNATKSILRKQKPAKVVSLGKPAGGVNVPGATKVEAKKADTSKWSGPEQDMARLLGEDALAEMGIG